ncbi:unnamed protein product, partial [Durusdinium trenchii]
PALASIRCTAAICSLTQLSVWAKEKAIGKQGKEMEGEEGQEYLSTSEKIKYFQKLLKTQAEEASKLPEDNHHEERFASSTPERIDFSYKDVAPESAAPGALNGSTATAADSEEVRLQQACKLQLPVESMQSPSTRATSSSPLGGYVASPSGSQRRAEIAAKAREAFQRSPPETPTASPGSRKAGGRRTAQRDNLAERAYQRYQEAWQNDF